MQDAFGVERDDISKGLPSALRAAQRGGKAVGGRYAAGRMDANMYGRAGDRITGGQIASNTKFELRSGAKPGLMGGRTTGDSALTMRRKMAVTRNKNKIMRRPMGGGAPGSNTGPVPKSYLRG